MSTKNKILVAATHLFAEKGYEGMTIKLIATEVGVTPPAVYAFFKNKEDVFLHIYKGVLSNHLQITSGIKQWHQKNSAKEQLDNLLDQVIEFQLKEVMQMKIYVRLMLFPPESMEEDIKAQLREVEMQERELLSDIFNRGMENGEIKQGDPYELATLMICVMDGLFWQMQRYDEATFKQQFKVIWDQFWQRIKSSESK